MEWQRHFRECSEERQRRKRPTPRQERRSRKVVPRGHLRYNSLFSQMAAGRKALDFWIFWGICEVSHQGERATILSCPPFLEKLVSVDYFSAPNPTLLPRQFISQSIDESRFVVYQWSQMLGVIF